MSFDEWLLLGMSIYIAFLVSVTILAEIFESLE